MKRRLSVNIFVYFLWVPFLVMVNGVQGAMAGASEKSLLVGHMVSRGEVRFEARENIWKPVEPSAFPLFKGTKVKTENGIAAIILPDVGQIEVGENSLFSYDERGDFLLFEGSISFRIREAAERRFGVGRLSIVSSRSYQASGSPSSAPDHNQEMIGSISIHPNGAVTVKTLQGSLAVIDERQTVLASLSSNQEVTIPSASVRSRGKAVAARASDPATDERDDRDDRKLLGLPIGDWIGIGVGAIGLGLLSVGIYDEVTYKDHDRIPVCP